MNPASSGKVVSMSTSPDKCHSIESVTVDAKMAEQGGDNM